MCESPLEFNGYQVSCRKCGQCLATYKNGWVARCLAEKAASNYSFAFTFTYGNDENGEAPLGARVFRYEDIKKFWKRLRRRAQTKFNEPLQLSYVIVGEKGSRNGRVHYHGMIFTSHDISQVGYFHRSNQEGFALKRRLDWDVWGHGFVEFQDVDAKGIAYTMKYVLKDKMSAKASEGQRREGKTEWLARSYLWCSKRPPIGARWLFAKLEELEGWRMCPSSLRVPLPGGGQWYVTGSLQYEMCIWLHRANARFVQSTGRNLAGWETLVDSVSSYIENLETGEMIERKPKEWLIHGEQKEQDPQVAVNDPEREFEEFRDELQRRQYAASRRRVATQTLNRCGRIRPCGACAAVLSDAARQEIETEYTHRFRQYVERYGETEGFEKFWLSRCRISRGCQCRNVESVKSDFRFAAQLAKANPRARARRGIAPNLQDPSE